VVLAIGAGAVALVGCGAATRTRTRRQSTAHPPAPKATQVRIFTPVSAANGALTVHVTSVRHGYCWTSSESVRGANAWRCFVGNLIHDPCFTGPTAAGSENTVVCPDEGPWTGSAIEIQLTRALPYASSEPTSEGPQGLPWAMQLADGSHCVFLQGASSAVDGLRFNYTCAPDKLALYGEPQRGSAVWTIFAGPRNASQLARVPIAIVWY
jgi:hypothetical protein